jgi:hypothetical protein
MNEPKERYLSETQARALLHNRLIEAKLAAEPMRADALLAELEQDLGELLDKQSAQIPFADQPADQLADYIMLLVRMLAESHGQSYILIAALHSTKLTPAQQALISAAAKEIAKSQNEFLKTFGDWAEPGTN